MALNRLTCCPGSQVLISLCPLQHLRIFLLIAMAVTRQPFAFGEVESEFQTGLCDCSSDCGVCMFGTFCHPCLGCSIASDMDECCLCGIGMPIRSVYRTRYNIKGSMCNDFLVAFFCTPCASCQLKRDINLRKEQGTF